MNVIVIGASSGMGYGLVKKLIALEYTVAATARRIEPLISLKEKIGNSLTVKQMDITQYQPTIKCMNEMVEELGVIDLIIITAGKHSWNPELDYEIDLKVIDVNVSGFTLLANYSVNYFIDQKKGHLVVLSSISALRGSNKAPSYPASKAYVSNYLQGLRKKVFKTNYPITITDIKPGYVKTRMVEGSGSFWMATVDEASDQIIDVIKHKYSYAYITKRWRLMAWLMKILPDFIFHRL